MKTTLWLIKAQTNLHVGNESTSNYGIIDKAIQRDALTGIPCINSSSLKGAINEYCCSKGQDGRERMDPASRKQIFGSDKKSSESKASKGEAVFYDAKLLFLPKQTDDANLYKYITSSNVLDLLEERMKMFGVELKLDRSPEALKIRFQLDRPVEVNDEDFASMCSDNELPIIARNRLDDGTSSNLWYEQILPTKTALYAITQESHEQLKAVLKDALVQIGANATIGYGYCKFTILK